MPQPGSAGQNGQVTSASIGERIRAAGRWLRRPTGPLPRPTRRNLLFDAGLTLAVMLVAVAVARYSVSYLAHRVMRIAEPAHAAPAMIAVAPPANQTSIVVLALVAAAPLVLRRRYPLAVLWVVMGITLSAVHVTRAPAFYACVVAAYTAAAYSPYRVPTLASLGIAAILVSGFAMSSVPAVPTRLVPYLILIPIVVAGNALRDWRRREQEGRARLVTLQRTRAEELRLAADQERRRIARELHDVVTHNVSVMVIQAGAARRVLGAAPDQAYAALLAVEAGGRAAMAELRHVMGLLAVDGEDPGQLAPQPGLDGLAALVDRVREAGVPVQLTVVGEPRPVPPGVDLTAYRVIQEALTNTVKHATGATATVLVEYHPDHLRVDVTDTGGQDARPAPAGTGRGLVGLRERVAVYGGKLRAGPRPTGGYRITATIPADTA
jgi:signal transduction histidine kinase